MGGSLLVVSLLAAVPAPSRAAELFLTEEPEIYAAVDKLNASGVLPGFLANTRPYSVSAVRAAADAALRESPPADFDGELLRWLAHYTAPKGTGRVTVAVSRADDRSIPANNEGIPAPEGWGAQGSLSAREEASPYLSAQLRALSFHGEGGDDGNRLLETALESGSGSASLQVGKITTWYGPGRRGALIFTNNAAPYPGVRLHNPQPIPLSGPLSFLGSVQYDVFLARMGRKTQRSRSTLFGMRLAARPAPWLELGVSRAMHYGGEGGSSSFSEFWTDFWGNNEPADRSNSLVGFDLTMTLPIKFQPVQIYWSPAGEHSKPRQWASQMGLYFPKVLGVSRLDLRAEYADTFRGQARQIEWYGSIYPHRYHGDLLGHAMGPYSRDVSVVSRYFLLPSSFVEVSYARVLHDGGARNGERHDIFGAGLSGWVAEKWRAEARASTDRLTHREGVPGSSRTGFSALLSVAYQVASSPNR